jgi:hypothetical protein
VNPFATLENDADGHPGIRAAHAGFKLAAVLAWVRF